MGTVASYVISVGAVSADDEATLAIFLFGFVFLFKKSLLFLQKRKTYGSPTKRRAHFSRRRLPICSADSAKKFFE
jgi:hypothetical protein